MRFSDWSSDVCSSDLAARAGFAFAPYGHLKLSAVIDGLGNIVDRLVPPEGPVHVINRRIAMWTEARARGLDRISGKRGAGASSEAARKSFVSGKSVSVSVDTGGRRSIKKKKKK